MNIIDKDSFTNKMINTGGFMKKNLAIMSTLLILGLIVISFAVIKDSTAQEKVYTLGSKGPAGGWIFYDKGSYSDGWRYLEAAPQDISARWGCTEKNIQAAKNTNIGTGKANTAAIIAGCEEEGIAAKLAAAYQGGGKTDWFLPSRDELNLMYENLKKKKIGGFSNYQCYWSSSQHDFTNCAWIQCFDNGAQDYGDKQYQKPLRPIRAF